jgi:imidazolonepropionase-like amidohydrolase
MRGLLIHAMVLVPTAGLLGQGLPTVSDTTRSFISVEAPVLALTHLRLIDGTGGPPADDQTVVIQNGVILSVGPVTRASIPAGARVLDLTNKTVTPGFVGLHDHMYYYSGPRMTEMSVSGPRLYLAGGVTTIRTAGAFFPYNELNLKHAIDQGQVPGPHIYVSVSISSTPSVDGSQPVATTPEQVRRVVDYWVDEGVSWFGEGLPTTRELMGAVIQEAHRRGAKVSGHICAVTHREAVALGIDGLDHGLITATDYLADKKPDTCPPDAMTGQIGVDLNSDAVKTTFKEMLDHHVTITSTLSVYELFVPTRPPSAAQEARVLAALSPDVVPEYRKMRQGIQSRSAFIVEPELFRKMMQYDHDFFRAGGLLTAGVDPWGHGSLPGYGNQRDYEILVEAGLTPAEAIKVMTADGAMVLGGFDRFGSVSAGKRADLVVFDGDPVTRPTDIEKVTLVFKDGMGYDAGKLIASAHGLVGLR